MAQVFHPSTNTIAKVSILGFAGIVCFVGGVLDHIHRSPYVTRVNVVRDQPVPFSHRHHVQGLGIDCRYCHTSVEESASAGVPSTKTCMTCHSVLFTDAEMLEPVRESWRTDRSIEWTRVHDLPDFAYFDHSIHLAKGIGCASCHGRVDRMSLMWRTQTLNMDWCLSCHRNPEEHVRPREHLFDMDWSPELPRSELGPRLVEEYDVEPRTDCSACHR